MEIKRAMVVGAGSMGAGIAQLFAQCGVSAILADISEEAASRAIEGLGGRLGRRVAQGKMRADEMKDILSRIRPAAGCGAAAEADFVLEAVFEEMNVKKKVFAELDGARFLISALSGQGLEEMVRSLGAGLMQLRHEQEQLPANEDI